MDSDHDITRATPQQWSQLIAAAEASDGEWKPEELGEILVHQLNAPVDFELEGVSAGEAGSTPPANLTAIHSFQELFQSPAPPLELLRLTKDYAKAHLAHPETTLAKEVATVLYYSSIALALVRHHTRITQLTSGQMAAGFEWCLKQDWMAPALRPVFESGLAEASAA